MRLQVKKVSISTGGVLVAIINAIDAQQYDLHVMDRITLKRGGKEKSVIVDITDDERIVPKGKLGVFQEVVDYFKLNTGDFVNVSIAKRPRSISFIKKKMRGEKLTKREIYEIVDDLVHNNLSEIELTYFVSACYTNGMNIDETISLTLAIVDTGEMLHLNKHPVVDKHCIGGVAGNRTTMVAVPILAAAGLTVPKTSSRSITSPAGTADTMEVLTNVSIPINKIKKQVEKIGACLVWGGALNLAPADDKIIKVERPLSIDADSQLIASVMAKKHSVGSTHILIDIPLGEGAKIEDMAHATKLKRSFEKIGKILKKNMKVVITNGNEPIGNGIGPALEARDVMWVLENDARAPFDLRKKSLYLAGELLELCGKAKRGQGEKMANQILDSGDAYRKMVEIIKAQGGKVKNPDKIKIGKYKFDYCAKKSMAIRNINNKAISKIARIAGAPQDNSAGLYLYKHVGSIVKKGEKIFTVYATNKEKLKYAKDTVKEYGHDIIK